MTRGLSYADAVRVLGGTQDRAIAALDRLTGGLSLVASAAGLGFVASLFDPAVQLARFSAELLGAARERIDGLSRFDRTECLAAAHAVVVMAAYFEELGAAELPFNPRELELSRTDQVGLATDGVDGASRLADLGRTLLRQQLPCPEPQRPYEVTVTAITGLYGELSASLVRFVEGLAVWDRLDDTARRRTHEVLREDQPGRATRRYEEMFRRLAVEFPEVAFWAGLVDHQATREQIRQLSEGLAGLGRVLDTMASGCAPDERRLALARSYRAALVRPILASGEIPPGIHIPLLVQGYVNPSFRVAYADTAEELAEEGWWRRLPIRDDLQEFLVGYLTAPQATDAPLLVLGQPGSGKSVLTRVLAAQLPPTDFLVVTVPLREVPADADVQAQIEYSIRSATGETVTWTDLARSAGGALPILIIDGFDELLQATGTSQSDYLEKVATFQRREAEQRRPVAVVVTSRTAVADRARSVSGMVAVRLERFAEGQIRRWLQIWNDTNANSLAARHLDPLPIDRVLAHPQLASQPLLLLMLALYDADNNALQRNSHTLAESELYERLLTGFAAREVRKTGAALPAAALAHAVEHELIRLSVVAFAMFNRNRQWVTQAELDSDLPALLGDQHHGSPTGLRAPLTAGDVAVGRFYFVHEAQALRDGARLRTYEFLHATFGEYLLARLVSRELTELAETAQLHATRGRLTPMDDAFLFALLSFSALTTRGTVVNFLRERLASLPSQQRELLKQQLLGMFHQALQPRRSHAYDGYQPAVSTVPGRHAAWAANLTMLAVLAGNQVTARELFPESDDGVTWWRQTALLWRSQLSVEGWNGLVHTLDVLREWDGNRRVIRVQLANGEPQVPPIDLNWTYNDLARHAERRGDLTRWRHYSFEDLRRHNRFLCDRTDDTVLHATEPFADALDAAVGTVHGLPNGTAVTPAHELLALMLSVDDTLVDAHERCLAIALHGFLGSASADTAAMYRYRTLVFRQLVSDSDRLPHDWLATAISRIAAAGLSTQSLEQLANRVNEDR